MQPGLNKRLLGGILGNPRVAAHSVDDVHHTLGMRKDQFVERISVAALRLGNKLYFVECRNRHYRKTSISASCLVILLTDVTSFLFEPNTPT